MLEGRFNFDSTLSRSQDLTRQASGTSAALSFGLYDPPPFSALEVDPLELKISQLTGLGDK